MLFLLQRKLINFWDNIGREDPMNEAEKNRKSCDNYGSE